MDRQPKSGEATAPKSEANYGDQLVKMRPAGNGIGTEVVTSKDDAGRQRHAGKAWKENGMGTEGWASKDDTGRQRRTERETKVREWGTTVRKWGTTVTGNGERNRGTEVLKAKDDAGRQQRVGRLRAEGGGNAEATRTAGGRRPPAQEGRDGGSQKIGVEAERNAVWKPEETRVQPKDWRGSRKECGVEAEQNAVCSQKTGVEVERNAESRRLDRSSSKKPQEWDEVAPSGTVVRKQPAEAKREP